MLGVLLSVAMLWQQDPLRVLLTADTSRAVRRAADAQAQFEGGRRYQLPMLAAGRGHCDERIGRFCYWYEEGDTTLPKDPPAIHRARAQLLTTLAEVAAQQPSSGWIAGQQVRYLVEQGEADSASALAGRCRSIAWWCDALAGFAHHVAGRFAASDSLFARSLSAMPEELRCFWADWTMVLDGTTAAAFDRLDCPAQRARADTLFQLAQPLLSRPGNDLRTELLSRRVMAALSGVARSPYQIPWGKDLEEMMIRYGWSTGWSQAEQSVSSLDQPSVVGHQRSPAYRFWPVPARDDPAGWAWDAKPERPRSRYAPAYLDRYAADLEYQIARFPRGDSTVVVAAIATERDTLLAGRPLDLALAVVSATGRTTIVRRDSSTPAPLSVTIESRAGITSVEANPSGRRAYRVGRRAFPSDSTTGSVVSDPLLFRAATDLPETLEEAARRALGSLRISRATPLGVYWEIVQPSLDSVAVAVAVQPLRRGLLGRLGEGLSLVNRATSLTLQWQAGPQGPGIVGRAFELDLSRLRPGHYRLRLTAVAGGLTGGAERLLILDP